MIKGRKCKIETARSRVNVRYPNLKSQFVISSYMPLGALVDRAARNYKYVAPPGLRANISQNCDTFVEPFPDCMTPSALRLCSDRLTVCDTVPQ